MAVQDLIQIVMPALMLIEGPHLLVIVLLISMIMDPLLVYPVCIPVKLVQMLLHVKLVNYPPIGFLYLIVIAKITFMMVVLEMDANVIILFHIYIFLNYLFIIECSYKCSTCSSIDTNCDTCSDVNRGPTLNCDCVATFYDDGVNAACIPCTYPC